MSRGEWFPAYSHSVALCLACILNLAAFTHSHVEAKEPFQITVVDQENGWPVPLVELQTTHQLRFVSDNAGIIAIDAPELIGRETWFNVSGHGYRVPQDWFGHSGVRLTPQPGAAVQLKVKRTNIAKRLGRLTGAGLFAESQKLGAMLDQPRSPVFGCDSVQTAIYQGKCFWLWGDTTLPGYQLGVYDSTSATTSSLPFNSLEPPVCLSYDYFTDGQGAPKGVAKMPGKGPTWISGYTTLPDKHGKERLVACYNKIEGHLQVYEIGLCVWNDEREEFERLKTIWTKTPEQPKRDDHVPNGHAIHWTDQANQEWVLFGNPFPKLRCPATFEAWQDPGAWEKLDAQKSLVSAHDASKLVVPQVSTHTGSIAWNAYRARWTTVFVARLGKTALAGDVWYAEADLPTGPWGPAVKVLAHDNYTFYNPKVHAEFSAPDSPILLFEGTYTAEFANRPAKTARYNYNQILYRLDLDDPALALAQAVTTSESD